MCETYRTAQLSLAWREAQANKRACFKPQNLEVVCYAAKADTEAVSCQWYALAKKEPLDLSSVLAYLLFLTLGLNYQLGRTWTSYVLIGNVSDLWDFADPQAKDSSIKAISS